MSKRDTSNKEIVRRLVEAINTSTSMEEAIATGIEELWDPEIEFVNPEDAIEGGTRRGVAGMRTVMENFIAGAGGGATVATEELEEKGDRILSIFRIRTRGSASGAEVVSPPVGAIYTFRDGRILRIEWHFGGLDKARAEFEQGG